jgi:L-fucose isomerase-like protein
MLDYKVAFVSIIRTTFDVPLAEQMTSQARARLNDAGYALIGDAAPLTTLEEAQECAAALSNREIDLLLIFQATFADSTMVMALAHAIDAPFVLWAVPEEHTGGRLRLNSLCGINLAGHALTRAGIHYAHIYGLPSDEAVIDAIRVQASAGRARAGLRHARFGRVGENPAGFDTCLVDHAHLRERLGVTVEQIDLHADMFAGMRAVPDAVTAEVGRLLAEQVVGLETMEAAATLGTLRAYQSLKTRGEEQRLDGYAVRCWPEFFTEMGCAACGALSLLINDGLSASCECDVNGTITQYILQTLSGAPAVGMDVVSHDDAADALVVWHCGLAPLAMADPDVKPGVTIHSNRKLPLLFEFPLKPGRVTVARLSQATGELRMVIAGGNMVRGEKPFSGTCGLLHFDRPARDVLDTILSEGLEHHLSFTYGDYRTELRALAHMLHLPILEL